MLDFISISKEEKINSVKKVCWISLKNKANLFQSKDKSNRCYLFKMLCLSLFLAIKKMMKIINILKIKTIIGCLTNYVEPL